MRIAYRVTLLICFAISLLGSLRAQTTQGLVAYYPFDGTASDSSGFGNNGTIVGGVSFEAGVSGQAARFSGSGSYIRVAHGSSISFTTAMTAAFWLRIETGGDASSRRLFDKSPTGTADGYGVNYYLFGSSDPRAEIDLLAAGETTSSPIINYTLQTWVHIAIVVNSGTQILYRNGVEVARASLASSLVTNSLPLIIGATQEGDFNFQGSLDEFRLYNRALAASEVATLAVTGPVLATVSTTAPANVTQTSATLGGNVASDGGAAVTQRGVVYGTSENPTTANGTFITSGSGLGNFSASSGTLAPGTRYHVRAFAINSAGTSYGANVTFTAQVGPTVSASHSSVGYTAGGTATVSVSVTYSGSLTSLGYKAVLPSGWSYAGGSNEPGVKPSVGQTGPLDWAWTSVPDSPAAFSFIVNVPAGTSGSQLITGTAVVRAAGSAGATETAATPSPLTLAVIVTQTHHSADINRDNALNLTELTRVIELFNTLSGTTRTGEYRSQAGTEDGFAAGSGSRSSFHSADTNRDGRLSLTELTRVIELFNTLSGTTRTGRYRAQTGTEDGFAPAP